VTANSTFAYIKACSVGLDALVVSLLSSKECRDMYKRIALETVFPNCHVSYCNKTLRNVLLRYYAVAAPIYKAGGCKLPERLQCIKYWHKAEVVWK